MIERLYASVSLRRCCRALPAGVARYLDEIDRVIDGATSGRLAGMIAEPVQGYGGIVPLPEGPHLLLNQA